MGRLEGDDAGFELATASPTVYALIFDSLACFRFIMRSTEILTTIFNSEPVWNQLLSTYPEIALTNVRASAIC